MSRSTAEGGDGSAEGGDCRRHKAPAGIYLGGEADDEELVAVCACRDTLQSVQLSCYLDGYSVAKV